MYFTKNCHEVTSIFFFYYLIFFIRWMKEGRNTTVFCFVSCLFISERETARFRKVGGKVNGLHEEDNTHFWLKKDEDRGSFQEDETTLDQTGTSWNWIQRRVWKYHTHSGQQL